MQKKIIVAGGVIIIIVAIAVADVLLTKNYQKLPPAQPPEIIETESIAGEAGSLEGTIKLTLKKKINKDTQTQTYSLFTSDSATPIFTKTLSMLESMAVPSNSWSPDNKYVFIEETNAQGEKDYLVFKASGEPVAKEQPYYDVKALFLAKKIKYTFSKAVGWASPTLLIVYTLTDQSAKGPSFWFEIPSKAFMQLAH